MLGAARRHVNQVAHVAEAVSFAERLGERGLTLVGGWASRARCRTLKRTGRPRGGASTAPSASRCADACPATELGLSDALRGPGTAESSQAQTEASRLLRAGDRRWSQPERAGHQRHDGRGRPGHGRQAAQVRGPDPEQPAGRDLLPLVRHRTSTSSESLALCSPARLRGNGSDVTRPRPSHGTARRAVPT